MNATVAAPGQHGHLRGVRRDHDGRGDPGIACQNKTAADYYTGGRSLHRWPERYRDRRRLPVGRELPPESPAPSLTGFDGFLYSIGFLVAWLVALLLVAELLRNTGRFTLMADVLAFGCGNDPCGWPLLISTLAVSSSTCWPRWLVPVAVSLLMGITGNIGRSSPSQLSVC